MAAKKIAKHTQKTIGNTALADLAALAKKHKKTSICVILILSLTFTYFLLPRESLTQKAINNILKNYGIETFSFNVTKSTATSVIIEDLSIGEKPDLYIKKAKITYNPASLAKLAVNSIELNDPILHLYYNETLSLGSLDPILTSNSNSNPNASGLVPKLPFNSLKLNNARIFTHSGKKNRALVAPLTINAKATNNNQLTASTTIQNDSNDLYATIGITHNYKTNKGKAKINLNELLFATGIIQPDQLFPVIRGKILSTSGSIDFDGTVNWENNTTSSNLVLKTRSFSTQFGNINVTGIDSDILINNIAPFSTDPKQTVIIQRLDSGIPLSKGKIVFDITNGNQLTLHETNWRWGEGELYSNKLSMDLTNSKSDKFILHVKEVPLNDIVMLDKTEFNATGNLSGKIPMRIDGSNLLIENGVLKTSKSGVVNYKPAENLTSAIAQNPAVALVFSILEDFHYEQIKMTLSSTDGSKVTAALNLAGSNPDVENGRLVKLNINLKGNIIDMVKSSIDTYELPKRLIEQIGNETF